jgi:hypothetical protein
MPQFDAQCAGGRSIDLDDLRGRAIRVIALGNASSQEAPPNVNTATILVARNKAPEPSDDVCVAMEPELWTALSIILGVSTDDLKGIQVLVDQNGWLRAAWRPGDSDSWDDAPVLAARVRDVLAHPLTFSAPSGHHH